MRSALAAAAALLAATPLSAQTSAQRPTMAVAEGLQLFNAAGFTLKGNKAFNSCGTATIPKFTYLDLNADGRPEAISFDRDPACYGPNGQFHVLVRAPSGIWRQIGGGLGTFQPLATRTRGWLDYTLAGAACPVWRFDGSLYMLGKPCPDAGAKKAVMAPPRAPSPAPAPTSPGALSLAEKTMIFSAAGAVKKGGHWRICTDDPRAEARIDEIRDINGDGRPEAIVSEDGLFCHGNTGTGFTLLSKQANGRWVVITESTGIPEFLRTRGVGGWPDISIGGPGFCFPVVRWNGKEYVLNRKEYEGKTCR